MTLDAFSNPDVPLTQYALLGLLALSLISVVVFTIVIRRRWRSRTRLGLLAALVVSLFIVSGLFCVGFRPIYPDAEGQWVCPTSAIAAFISENGGQPLPDGVAECRADARRNIAVAAVAALLGIGVTVGVHRRSLRTPVWAARLHQQPSDRASAVDQPQPMRED